MVDQKPYLGHCWSGLWWIWVVVVPCSWCSPVSPNVLYWRLEAGGWGQNLAPQAALGGRGNILLWYSSGSSLAHLLFPPHLLPSLPALILLQTNPDPWLCLPGLLPTAGTALPVLLLHINHQ